MVMCGAPYDKRERKSEHMYRDGKNKKKKKKK
jgi:hypothetical protein